MRSSTLLDSAIFQLTPTRTRCDLIITANGKTEKITTGLLNPFLAHLKTAQDQIAKGGYSILLEPESGCDASWFTKGTLERFVRFVSTPDILERVYTIESEILQIEEAIVIQGKNDLGLNNVEHRQPKPVTNHEASIKMPDANEEKAIILYKPDAQHEANGSNRHEENSKVQLLKVLESRRANLQKEQGMAFARAVAAGFDIDHVTPLLSFAECFGATRLMSACSLFMDLWKRKHESGQLLEIQNEVEALSIRPDFCTMNTSGTMLSNNEPHSELASDNKGNGIIGGGAEERHPVDQKSPGTQQEYCQGQFPHPGFPSWPMHSPPGTLPIYPTYPVQGMPYYQGFPGNGALFQPPYRMDDYQPNNAARVVRKRHSIDTEFDEMEIDGSKSNSKDGLELIKDESINQELRKKTSRLGKKKSGGVVIKNINYISKRKSSSDSESESSSESEIGQESQDTRDGTSTTIHKNPASFKRKGEHAKAELFKNDHHETSYGNETDGGHWQAFQNILLRDADEDKKYISDDNGMFASEKNIQMKRKPNLASEDPLALGNQNPDGHGHNATKYMEMRGKGVYRSTTDDRFMVDGQERQQFRNSSDLLAVDGFEYTSNNLTQSSPGAIPDESFIVPFRSMTLNQIGIDDRTTIDVNSELPSKLQKSEYNSFKANKSSYEPYDLNLMPERRVENETAGYDPDLEYKLQVRGTVAKNLDGDRKSKALPGTSDKKKSVGPIRKAKQSKMSPLDDARARAEKLRSYKADLQKMKKENEEKELKRLEALKNERLKRIATKGNSTPTPCLLSSPQSKKQLPTTKLSPSSHPGSKFSDSQPGPTSPLQRSKIRISSHISSTSNSASKTSKTINNSQLARNRLVKSVSSLPDQNKDNGVASDTKASMARIRRLSEPRTMNNPNVVPPVKRSLEPVSKPKVFSGHDSKKVSPIINPTKSKVKRTIDGRTKPAAKEMTEKVEGAKIFKLGIDQTVCDNDIDTDENPVIEKTVVMLECGKPSVAVPHASSEHVGQQTGQFDNKEESIDMKKGKKSFENGLHMHGVSKLAGGGKQDQIVAHEEMTRLSEEKQQKFDGNSAVEKSYQAPYARPSSLDDKSVGNSEYAKAPSVMLDMPVAETSKIHVSGSNGLKLERIPEMPEMLPQLKESPKGFKRLLHFGKKKHSSSSSDKKLVSNNASYGSEAGESARNAVHSEVRTLKNLISLDESPPTSGSKSQKPSRHFSLLTSPFRSKPC